MKSGDDGCPARITEIPDAGTRPLGSRTWPNAEQDRPWRLEMFVDDEQAVQVTIGASDWRTLSLDLSKRAGKDVRIRLYQHAVNVERRSAYWRGPRIE